MMQINPLPQLHATLTVPGSKYIANRVLMLTALAQGTSRIRNLPDNDDIRNFRKVLRQIGIPSEADREQLLIHGGKSRLLLAEETLHVGESGTLMRFATALAALVPGTTTISGSERIRQRPIRELTEALRELGVECHSLNHGFPPVVVESNTLQGGRAHIPGHISSQYISALLMIAPYAQSAVDIRITSEPVSQSYIDLTIDLMRKFGISVERPEAHRYRVQQNQHYRSIDYSIPGDWSSANYFLAAAAILNGTVTVRNLDLDSKHGEAGFSDALARMGGHIRKDPARGTISVEAPRQLNGIDIDMSSMPDAVPSLAAVAAFAHGRTQISNIGHLKYKESDRITAIQTEWQKMGIQVESTSDSLLIHGGRPHGAKVDSHNDHRLAMSLAIMGLKTGEMQIDRPEAVNKSFPGFWQQWQQLGAEVHDVG